MRKSNNCLISMLIFLISFCGMVQASTQKALSSGLNVGTNGHYISARTGQTAYGVFTLDNNSDEPITNIVIHANNPALIFGSQCASGLLAKQSCEIQYEFHPDTDSSEKHNGIVGKHNILTISYKQSKIKKALTSYIVSMHYDSQRIIKLPESLSTYHKIPTGLANINDLYYDSKSQKLFMATDAGLGISDDGGINWHTLTTTASTLNIASNNPTTDGVKLVYANGNEIYVIISSAQTKGALLKSLNHGATWQIVKRNLLPVSSMYIDGKNIYLAVSFGIQISHDSGVTWKRNLPNVSPNDITTGFVNGNKALLIAASGSFSKVGLYISLDRGKTFNPLIAAEKGVCEGYKYCGVSSVKILRNNIYASLTLGGGAWTGKLIKSSDGGKTWQTLVNYPNNPGAAISIYDDEIIAPLDDGNYYISFDGGKTWPTKLPFFPYSNKQPVVQAMFNGTHKIFLTSNNHLIISDDNGLNWVTKEGSPMIGASIYSIYTSDNGKNIFTNNEIMFKQASTLSFSADRGASWQAIHLGQHNPTVDTIFMFDNKLYYFGDYSLGISKDFGKTWQNLYPKLNSVYANSLVVNNNSLYLTGFANLSTERTPLAVSHDNGVTWNQIGPTGSTIPKLSSTCSLIVKQVQQSIYLLAHDCDDQRDNGLFISNQNGAVNSWYSKFIGDDIENVIVNRKNIYVIDGASLKISHDSGVTWRNVNIAIASGKKVKLLGARNNVIYIAIPVIVPITDYGYDSLEASTDDGNSWINIGSIQSPDFNRSGQTLITDISMSKNTVYIATKQGLFAVGLL